ncbi:MAG: cyclic pyranopterin monophosphate synthase MoaC [Lachnospiraceae bacterium]|jgi:cyclic pyranopterin phosphate synthase|nr:cyclic pyranopterin monophosphate synthase MoaC [Lachnospiraceae bacterium]
MELNSNHFDNSGNAVMVDIGEKEATKRIAVASGKIFVDEKTYKMIAEGKVSKGDVLGVARIAGIMAAKQTFLSIPLCHPISIESISIDFEFPIDEASIDKKFIKAICSVKTTGTTGVEMEALNGVCIALLTIYDMCKSIEKGMTIGEIQLEKKSGGKSGNYERQL